MTEISRSLADNRAWVEQEIEGCSDILMRPVREGFLVYPEMAVNSLVLEESGFEDHLLQQFDLGQGKLKTMEFAMAAMLAGNAVYFREGYPWAFKVESQGYPGLGVRKAESEKVLRGSLEAFTESVKVNAALVRKRIRNCQVKAAEYVVGSCTNTMTIMMWLDEVAYDPIRKDMQEKLGEIAIDGIEDGGMIEHLTENFASSPFPQFQTTERPDRAAQAILEGRMVLLTDYSPEALLFPATCNTLFQTSDDYYRHYLIVSFLRFIRYIAAFLAITLPGLYVAAVTFHTQFLPAELIRSMAEARAGVPLPAVGEVLFMELSFELLREAGLRMPGPIGNTIGIVGGLIVGQSAVSANLVSPITVVVVALTALGSFSIPNEEVSEAARIVKYGMLLLCTCFGGLGAMAGWAVLLIHMSGLKSFGVPWLYPYVGSDMNQGVDRKDSIFLTKVSNRVWRPLFANRRSRFRSKRREEER